MKKYKNASLNKPTQDSQPEITNMCKKFLHQIY